MKPPSAIAYAFFCLAFPALLLMAGAGLFFGWLADRRHARKLRKATE